VRIQPERVRDHPAIHAVTVAAFQSSSYGHNGEAGIVEALRTAGVLTVSLVAEAGGDIVGHIAFSPVRIAAAEGDWYGLGPLSVIPAWQGRGVGRALVQEGLLTLAALDAAGCVVLGDPAYYGRFGFENDPEVRYGPPEAWPYMQRLILRGRPPSGDVRYHAAFDV
jgi:predicted N-acetyltransferase YhbS